MDTLSLEGAFRDTRHVQPAKLILSISLQEWDIGVYAKETKCKFYYTQENENPYKNI